MWEFLRHISSAKFAPAWAVGVWVLDLALTIWIVRRVPFTNIDWDTYMAQVDGVLGGELDYSKLMGPTGPLVYPCGHCWVYGALRWLNVGVAGAQAVFGAVYLATVALVLAIYVRAEAPGWLLVLCILSKRIHSVYVLRLFNDGLAQLFLYAALLLFLQRQRLCSSLAYSFAVSVKMQPLLYCPAVGLSLVLSGGWSCAAQQIFLMVLLQVVLALPFLMASPLAYLSHAFGGPGDLQHAWSCNWRFLPEAVFSSRLFVAALRACHLGLLAWFAQCRWIPGGVLGGGIWRWKAHTHMDDRTAVGIWFGCNFVGMVFMRTIHFQYLAWYFHCVPFLAWSAIQPDRHSGFAWAWRCSAVAVLTLMVEVPYLVTTRGWVRGPDGRSWETDGVPTKHGSGLLLVAHGALLCLIASRKALPAGTKTD